MHDREKITPPEGNGNNDFVRESQHSEKETKNPISFAFLILLLVAALLTFFNVVKIFLVPLLIAALFTVLFYPMYKKILKWLHGRKGLGAILCCGILLLILVAPVYIAGHIIGLQAISLYTTAEPGIREFIREIEINEDTLPGILSHVKLPQWAKQGDIDWQAQVQNAMKKTGTVVAGVLRKTSEGVFQFFTHIFVMFFSLFYFFRDGDRIIERVKQLIPLEEREKEAIFTRFVSVSRATLKGTLLIGLTQGLLGGVTFYVFGIDAWLIWAVIMVILAIIPVAGPALVMIPAGIIKILLGDLWQGIAIILIGAVVVSGLDNILRPRLIGHESGMHDLLIFISIFGGISMFGIMGFIVGPAIAALFLTILDIYRFKFVLRKPFTGAVEKN
jgi:predicted PurR-regulated permease PerM